MKQGLHHQQLFHWIGRDIEEKLVAKNNPLSHEQANTLYLSHLQNSLKHGIWLNPTNQAEYLGHGKATIELNRPIACFTEWNLRDSRPHTQKYGRLGFGFARNWVISRGGQPVTYVRPAQDCTYAATATSLYERLKRLKKGGKEARTELEILLSYSRSLRGLPPPTEQPKEKPTGTVTTKTKTSRPKDPHQRKWPAPMTILEEREWRIVHAEGLKHCKANTASGATKPAYYLPYTTGTHLFTLVVPNNEILNRVVNNDELRKQLFPDHRPHVSLLSWQDLGSF
jgi:hypothetical protein